MIIFLTSVLVGKSVSLYHIKMWFWLLWLGGICWKDPANKKVAGKPSTSWKTLQKGPSCKWQHNYFLGAITNENFRFFEGRSVTPKVWKNNFHPWLPSLKLTAKKDRPWFSQSLESKGSQLRPNVSFGGGKGVMDTQLERDEHNQPGRSITFFIQRWDLSRGSIGDFWYPQVWCFLGI